ncbi:MAG TPA: hypothetical protein VMM17_04875 [Gemmatimonadaceae bacterium]|nr:hypothetical protein [Gemmatimonadaceae bacterium]
MDEQTMNRLSVCERRNRRFAQLLVVQSVIVVLMLASFVVSCTSAAVTAQPTSSPSLRVSELVVVDPNGIERVRIGGDLPDAVIDGRRVPRGEKVAGVLLYDGTGVERGGYVTFEPSGNVALTLDSRRRQVTLFVAGPDDASALQLWHRNDMIELRSDEDGSRLTAVRSGEVVMQQPPISGMSANSCAGYLEARSRVSREQLITACRRRFHEAACSACIQ